MHLTFQFGLAGNSIFLVSLNPASPNWKALFLVIKRNCIIFDIGENDYEKNFYQI
jgi:hypothetical protein